MEDKKQPSKESVRQWLRNQIEERRPPPDPKPVSYTHLTLPTIYSV